MVNNKLILVIFSLLYLNVFGAEQPEDPISRRNQLVRKFLDENPNWTLKLPGVTRGIVVTDKMVHGDHRVNSLESNNDDEAVVAKLLEKPEWTAVFPGIEQAKITEEMVKGKTAEELLKKTEKK